MKNNYLIVPNFISLEKAEEIRQNIRNDSVENNYEGDGQAPNSASVYNHTSCLELLTNKTSHVSDLIGESVLPTYAYSRIYYKGSILDKHVDREECEVSLTVHLGSDCSWPIFIQTPDKEEVSVDLNPGDAMIYYGCVAPHWREQYDGEEYSQVFLHYVKTNGKNSDRYFDRKTWSAKTRDVSDFILHEKNFVEGGFCSQLVSEYSDSNEWIRSKVSSGEQPTVRNCFGIDISTEEIISKNKERRQELDDKMFEYVGSIVNLYNIKNPAFRTQCTQDSGYNILKYEIGGFYIQHTDTFKDNPRELTVIFNLNDEYEGGELAFFDRKKVYKLGIGDAIVFPSNFMYPHEILPVTSGTRYSMITWMV